MTYTSIQDRGCIQLLLMPHKYSKTTPITWKFPMQLLSRCLVPNMNVISRRLPEIYRQILWHLMPFRPVADCIKVLTHMLGIEVYERVKISSIDPDRAEDARVSGAHQALADEIETVC